MGQQEWQERLALGIRDASEPDGGRADEEPFTTRVAVGPYDGVLDRLGDRRPVVGSVARVGAVDAVDGLQQLLDRLGQAVDAITAAQTQAGMLLACSAVSRSWRPNETYFLQAIGDQMLLTVNHLRMRTSARTVGAADEKTGLLARSSYLDCLLHEAQSARRLAGLCISCPTPSTAAYCRECQNVRTWQRKLREAA